MKILKKNMFSNIFPMKITCKKSVDQYGFTYGDDKDFCGSELEIDMSDIKKHGWEKYPDYSGIDYGVICPVCGKFITIDRKLLPEYTLKNATEIRLNG